MSLSKQRETRHPVTASSGRVTTASVKSRRSATEKRSSVGDKPRSSHKEDKDNNTAKPVICVSTPKDEKKEEEKQLVKDKMEAGNKQRFVLHSVSTTTDSLSLIGKSRQGQIYDNQLKKKKNIFIFIILAKLSLNIHQLGFRKLFMDDYNILYI